eukprot:207099-Hanusia_phi.AAC.8
MQAKLTEQHKLLTISHHDIVPFHYVDTSNVPDRPGIFSSSAFSASDPHPWSDRQNVIRPHARIRTENGVSSAYIICLERVIHVHNHPGLVDKSHEDFHLSLSHNSKLVSVLQSFPAISILPALVAAYPTGGVGVVSSQCTEDEIMASRLGKWG